MSKNIFNFFRETFIQSNLLNSFNSLINSIKWKFNKENIDEIEEFGDHFNEDFKDILIYVYSNKLKSSDIKEYALSKTCNKFEMKREDFMKIYKDLSNDVKSFISFMFASPKLIYEKYSKIYEEENLFGNELFDTFLKIKLETDKLDDVVFGNFSIADCFLNPNVNSNILTTFDIEKISNAELFWSTIELNMEYGKVSGQYNNQITSFARAIEIMKMISPAWTQLRVSSETGSESDKIMNQEVNYPADINQVISVYRGNYNEVPNDYPQATGIAYNLISNFANFNKLSNERKMQVSNYLINNRSSFNNALAQSAKIITDVIERECDNPEMIEFGDNKLAFKVFNKIRNNYSMIKSYNLKTKINFIIGFYLPTINSYQSKLMNSKVQYVRVNSEMLNIDSIDSINENDKYEIDEIDQIDEIGHISKKNPKEDSKTNISYQQLDDLRKIQMYGGVNELINLKVEKMTEDELIKETTKLQMDFNKKYEELYREMVKNISNIELPSVYKEQINNLYPYCKLFDNIAIKKAKTAYRISGLYAKNSVNTGYRKMVSGTIYKLKESKLSCFTPVINTLEKMEKLLIESSLNARNLRLKFLKSPRNSAGLMMQASKAVKIPCNLTNEDFIAYDDAINKLLWQIRNNSSESTIFNNKDEIKRYIEMAKDRSEFLKNQFDQEKLIIRNQYSDNKFVNLKEFMRFKYGILDRVQEGIIYINDVLEPQLSKLKIDSEKMIEPSQIKKIEDSYLMFQSTRLTGDFRKEILRLDKYIRKNKDVFSIASQIKKIFVSSGYIKFIEMIYRELNIFPSNFNWEQLNSQLTNLLVFSNLEVKISEKPYLISFPKFDYKNGEFMKNKEQLWVHEILKDYIESIIVKSNPKIKQEKFDVEINDNAETLQNINIKYLDDIETEIKEFISNNKDLCFSDEKVDNIIKPASLKIEDILKKLSNVQIKESMSGGDINNSITLDLNGIKNFLGIADLDDGKIIVNKFIAPNTKYFQSDGTEISINKLSIPIVRFLSVLLNSFKIKNEKRIKMKEEFFNYLVEAYVNYLNIIKDEIKNDIKKLTDKIAETFIDNRYKIKVNLECDDFPSIKWNDNDGIKIHDTLDLLHPALTAPFSEVDVEFDSSLKTFLDNFSKEYKINNFTKSINLRKSRKWDFRFQIYNSHQETASQAIYLLCVFLRIFEYALDSIKFKTGYTDDITNLLAVLVDYSNDLNLTDFNKLKGELYTNITKILGLSNGAITLFNDIKKLYSSLNEIPQLFRDQKNMFELLGISAKNLDAKSNESFINIVKTILGTHIINSFDLTKIDVNFFKNLANKFLKLIDFKEFQYDILLLRFVLILEKNNTIIPLVQLFNYNSLDDLTSNDDNKVDLINNLLRSFNTTKSLKDYDNSDLNKSDLEKIELNFSYLIDSNLYNDYTNQKVYIEATKYYDIKENLDLLENLLMKMDKDNFIIIAGETIDLMKSCEVEQELVDKFNELLTKGQNIFSKMNGGNPNSYLCVATKEAIMYTSFKRNHSKWQTLIDSSFESLIAQILGIFDKYWGMKYQGKFKIPVGMDEMLRGGSIFDNSAFHDISEAQVIPDATPFYIIGLNIIEFYVTQLTNMGGVSVDNISSNIKLSKLSPLNQIFKIFTDYKTKLSNFSISQLTTCVGILNDIWEELPGTNIEKLSAGIDYILNELNASMIVSNSLEKSLMESGMSTNKFSSISLDDSLKIIEKIYKSSLIESTKSSNIDQQNIKFEKILHNSLIKIRETPEIQRMVELRNMITHEKDLEKSGLDPYYKLMELVIVPLILCYKSYSTIAKLFNATIYTFNNLNEIFEKNQVDLNNKNLVTKDSINTISISLPSKDSSIFDTIKEVREAIEKNPDKRNEIINATASKFNDQTDNILPEIQKYNMQILNDILINYLKTGRWELLNKFWDPMNFDTYPTEPKYEYKSGKDIKNEIKMLSYSKSQSILKLIFPEVSSNNLFDYLETLKSRLQSDIDACIHLMMSFPYFSDSVVDNIRTEIHDQIAKLTEKIIPAEMDNKYLSDRTEIPEFYPKKLNVYGLSVYDYKYIPQLDPNDTIIIPASNGCLNKKWKDMQKNIKVHWIDWVVNSLAELSIDYTIPYELMSSLVNSSILSNYLRFNQTNIKGQINILYGDLVLESGPNPDDKIYCHPWTVQCVGRSISEKNRSIGELSAYGENYVNNLITLIPYVLAVLNAAANSKYNTEKEQTELNEIIGILTNYYNDIIIQAKPIKFLQTSTYSKDHVIGEILKYQDKSIEDLKYNLCALEWANKYKFAYLTSITFPEFKNSDRFEWINNYAEDIFKFSIFTDNFEIIKSNMGIHLWNLIICNSNKHDRRIFDIWNLNEMETALNIITNLQDNELNNKFIIEELNNSDRMMGGSNEVNELLKSKKLDSFDKTYLIVSDDYKSTGTNNYLQILNNLFSTDKSVNNPDDQLNILKTLLILVNKKISIPNKKITNELMVKGIEVLKDNKFINQLSELPMDCQNKKNNKVSANLKQVLGSIKEFKKALSMGQNNLMKNIYKNIPEMNQERNQIIDNAIDNIKNGTTKVSLDYETYIHLKDWEVEVAKLFPDLYKNLTNDSIKNKLDRYFKTLDKDKLDIILKATPYFAFIANKSWKKEGSNFFKLYNLYYYYMNQKVNNYPLITSTKFNIKKNGTFNDVLTLILKNNILFDSTTGQIEKTILEKVKTNSTEDILNALNYQNPKNNLFNLLVLNKINLATSVTIDDTFIYSLPFKFICGDFQQKLLDTMNFSTKMYLTHIFTVYKFFENKKIVLGASYQNSGKTPKILFFEDNSLQKFYLGADPRIDLNYNFVSTLKVLSSNPEDKISNYNNMKKLFEIKPLGGFRQMDVPIYHPYVIPIFSLFHNDEKINQNQMISTYYSFDNFCNIFNGLFGKLFVNFMQNNQARFVNSTKEEFIIKVFNNNSIFSEFFKLNSSICKTILFANKFNGYPLYPKIPRPTKELDVSLILPLSTDMKYYYYYVKNTDDYFNYKNLSYTLQPEKYFEELKEKKYLNTSKYLPPNLIYDSSLLLNKLNPSDQTNLEKDLIETVNSLINSDFSRIYTSIKENNSEGFLLPSMTGGNVNFGEFDITEPRFNLNVIDRMRTIYNKPLYIELFSNVLDIKDSKLESNLIFKFAMQYFHKKDIRFGGVMNSLLFGNILINSVMLKTYIEKFKESIKDIKYSSNKPDIMPIVISYLDNFNKYLPELSNKSWLFFDKNIEYSIKSLDSANKLTDLKILPTVNSNFDYEMIYRYNDKELNEKDINYLLKRPYGLDKLVGSQLFSEYHKLGSLITYLQMIIILIHQTSHYDSESQSDIPYSKFSTQYLNPFGRT